MGKDLRGEGEKGGKDLVAGGLGQCQECLLPEGNRYLVVVQNLYVVALHLFRGVPSVNTDGLTLLD